MGKRKYTHPRVERALEAAGFRLVRQRKHLIYRHADGRQIVMSRSPSDGQRASKNAAAIARKYGIDV